MTLPLRRYRLKPRSLHPSTNRLPIIRIQTPRVVRIELPPISPSAVPITVRAHVAARKQCLSMREELTPKLVEGGDLFGVFLKVGSIVPIGGHRLDRDGLFVRSAKQAFQRGHDGCKQNNE